MSRNRRERGNANSAFDALNLNGSDDSDERDDLPQATATDIANEAYGGVVEAFAGVGREKISRKPIAAITPDRTQPRRAIPAAMRYAWSGSSQPDEIAALFREWLAVINRERTVADEAPFPLVALLLGDETPRSASAHPTDDGDDDAQLDQIGSAFRPHPLEKSLLKVVDLAASIRRDGLTNPITLAQRGRDYEIETGERRWLAYHLLHWQADALQPHTGEQVAETEYDRIPARLVSDVDMWRQANENNARADLNAIGKARQFALLLMNLRESEYDADYAPFDAFEHEQAFYAQVADGNTHRVPRGFAEKLTNAMGFSDGGQLRHIRRLLRLPQLVWILADDLDWTEYFIQRNLLANKDDDETIRVAMRQALRDGCNLNMYPLAAEYEHLLDTPKTEIPPYSLDDFVQGFASKFASKASKELRKLDGDDRQKAIEHLREILHQL